MPYAAASHIASQPARPPPGACPLASLAPASLSAARRRVMMISMRLLLVAFSCCCESATAMENGAARTPPLGFNTWNGFHMTFNASLIRQTAKAMKQRGLMDAGYKLLTIAASTYEHSAVPPWNSTPWPKGVTVRNSTGFIQIDPARWPGPGSNMSVCGDAAVLSACLGVGTKEARTPEQCGCVNGNEGMRLLIAEVKQMGFSWGSYSNEAGCMVEACAVPGLEQSQREGFVSQDRALYIDEWGSEYLMIDSVGITSPDCPGPNCGRNRGNRTYGQQLMQRWARALMAPNPANEPVILHSCHNLCQNDFTGPTLALTTCDPQDGRQQWAFNDMNNRGRFVLRQVGGSGLCAGCGNNPEVSCANTAPGGVGANYGAKTWPANLTSGLGLGMQACIGGAKQAWNYSAADGMLLLPKDSSCLGVPSISSGYHPADHLHPVVRQRAANGDCNATHPRPHQQWILIPAEHGQLVASSANTSLCLTEGPETKQVLSGPASDGSRREMPAAETWSWCLNNSNMFRTNTDVNPSWGSLMEQLEALVGLGNISRPGAWAFPDALEVGVHGSLTWVETKAHVALWAVTSSPLFLACDVREGYMQQRLVDLMVNRAMLDVNQQYAGFAGDRLWSNATGKELWAKPLPAGAVGAVMFNRNGSTAGCRNPSKRALDIPCDDDPVLVHEGAQIMELEFASLPRHWLGLDAQPRAAIICNISDIFPATVSNASGPAHDKPLGRFTGKFTAVVPPHGVSFVRVSSCRYEEHGSPASPSLSTSAVATQQQKQQLITVDPSGPGLRFDGHGGLSAGASSRLLFDYAPVVRDEILDYLYKPKFGANLWVCKVEIGGDTQSSDGTEPSHMHSRDDLNCTRGYEFWLMKEAKKRNPKVITYGLSWGVPGWINNQTGYYGTPRTGYADQITYQVNWLKCARDHHQIDVDYLGLWNERQWGTVDFVKDLRKSIVAANLTTQLILGDGSMPPVLKYENDSKFMASFAGIGLHYPCTAVGRPDGRGSEEGEGGRLLKAGMKLWSSEDFWTEAEWPGAACWAKLLNQNFIRANLTATIAWSTIWSVYPLVDNEDGIHDSISGDGYWGPGLMYAWQPWSGHYVVPPTVWASAHTNQFVQPGWKILHGGSGNLTHGGSYVTLVSPEADHFSTIIETGHAHCDHCPANNDPKVASTIAQDISIRVLGVLAPSVHIWHTDNDTHTFAHVGSFPIKANGVVTLTVQPESIYTITTTTGQSRGSFDSPPAASSAFPLNWTDTFDSSVVESLPKFWADQCGSFQIMPSGGGRNGNSMLQRVVQPPGVNKWTKNLQNPLSILGNPKASAATQLTVDARVPPEAARPVWVGLCGRVSTVGHNQAPGGVSAGVCLQLNETSATDASLSWRIEEDGERIVASGTLHNASLSDWHMLELSFGCDGGINSSASATIDGNLVGVGTVSAIKGMAALATGWHVGEFDRFTVASCS